MASDEKMAFNVLDGIQSRRADHLHRLLIERGINFSTGVPCGVLRHVIQNLITDERVLHVPVNRESEAVGVAAGAYLAGKVPLVYMQNSGLFSASNDIASLLVPYQIPVLFIVSFRGCEGEDAVQHLTTGKATEALLRAFELPYVIYHDQDLGGVVSHLFETMRNTSLPTFLLVKRGWHR